LQFFLHFQIFRFASVTFNQYFSYLRRIEILLFNASNGRNILTGAIMAIHKLRKPRRNEDGEFRKFLAHLRRSGQLNARQPRQAPASMIVAASSIVTEPFNRQLFEKNMAAIAEHRAFEVAVDAAVGALLAKAKKKEDKLFVTRRHERHLAEDEAADRKHTAAVHAMRREQRVDTDDLASRRAEAVTRRAGRVVVIALKSHALAA
jgi:hypothetical protein